MASLVAVLQVCITFATVITIAAQGIFVLNVAITLLRNADARDTNPWRAASLEWVAGIPARELTETTVYRGAYEFLPTEIRYAGNDFMPQNAPTEIPAPPPAGFNSGAAPLNPLGST